ncbi:HERV-K-3q27.3 provirus ancestral Pol protein [Cricetulus griseus]|nr:HERV-K-3q27.3 provirus ancestral Pol protein [Cricetulus griseus]
MEQKLDDKLGSVSNTLKTELSVTQDEMQHIYDKINTERSSMSEALEARLSEDCDELKNICSQLETQIGTVTQKLDAKVQNTQDRVEELDNAIQSIIEASKGKLGLHPLTGKDSAEIIVPLSNEEISSLWKDNEYWQIALTELLGMISNNYPKLRIKLIKKTVWILPHIIRQTPISGVLTFYTDANKSGKADYKAGEVSKVVQSPYTCVQKAKLHAILMVLMDFTELLNIVTDSQYAKRVMLHIETAEFIPDNTELTSLFIQLQETIRNRSNPIYNTHIRSHTGLPGPLAQGNDEIDHLLIGSVLKVSEFHKKHHVNSKALKKDFSITWQQAKEIVRNCPTCSFYNQTPLPTCCNPKGIRRNEVWQMDVFHFAEFGNLKYVHASFYRHILRVPMGYCS